MLSNGQLRQQYDEFGINVLGGQYKALREYFGKRKRALNYREGVRGKDISTVIGLDFQEAVTGARKAVSIASMARCASCQVSEHPLNEHTCLRVINCVIHYVLYTCM